MNLRTKQSLIESTVTFVFYYGFNSMVFTTTRKNKIEALMGRGERFLGYVVEYYSKEPPTNLRLWKGLFHRKNDMVMNIIETRFFNKRLNRKNYNRHTKY